MKILIAAHDVAPLDLISSQRINHFIEFFCAQGYQVDVLTSKKRAIDGPISDIEKYNQLISRANFIEIPSTINEYKTNESKNTLEGLVKKSNKREFLKIVRSILVKFTGQMLDYRSIWVFNAIKYIKKTDEKYDVILTSSLPACVNWLGWAIKKKNTKVLWIADFRDLWTLNHLIQYNFISRAIDHFLEKKFLIKADLITTVSSEWCSQMEKLHNKEVLLVRNGFVPDEYKNIQANKDYFNDDGKINIVYAGNIYKGRRDPTKFLDIIQKHNLENNVNIHFFGHYLANLTEIVNANNANSYCFFHKPLSRNKMLSVLKASDFNLFLESDEDDAKGVIPGKIFELIALGNPIITIGPRDDFESVQLIKSSGLFVDLPNFIEKLKMNEKYLSNSGDQAFLETIAGRNEQVNKIHQFIQQKTLSKIGI